MQARLPLVIAIGLTVANACAAADKLTFEGDIRPILRQHCFDCHGAAKELKGKLDLRLARFAIRGGETGSAIVPGKPDDSLLLERIRSGEMPPGEHQVPADQIAKFAAWIEQGAPLSLLAIADRIASVGRSHAEPIPYARSLLDVRFVTIVCG